MFLKNNQIFIVRFAVAGIILCSGLLAFAILSNGTNWGGDFASYIMQAQNIVEGSPQKFIDANRFTIEKSPHKIGPVAYPWGTSLLLSPFIGLFGMNILALKGLNLICYMLFLLVLWFYMRNRLSVLYAVGLIAIFAFNPFMLSFLNHILSDIPFLLFSTVTLYLIGSITVEERTILSPLADRLLLGFFLAFSFTIRTNGILLFATLLSIHCYIMINIMINRYLPAGISKTSPADISRRLKTERTGSLYQTFLLNLMPYAVFICFTLIWRYIFPSGGTSHLKYLEDVRVGLIFHNTKYYLEIISTFFSRIPLPNILYGATLPFLFIGIIQSQKRDLCIIVYCFLTIALYVIWPVADQGLRFLFPILPFYLYFVFAGLRISVRSLQSPKKRLFVHTLIVFLLVVISAYFMKSNVAQAAKNLRNQRYDHQGAFSKAADDVFAFIRANTESNDILIFRKPRVMRLRTGRHTIIADTPAGIFKGDYLCYDIKKSHLQLSLSQINELVGKNQLQHIYSNDVFRLYRITNPQNTHPREG